MILALALVAGACLILPAHASYIPMYSPREMATDASGNLYAIDGGGSAIATGIYIYAPDGRAIGSFPMSQGIFYSDIAVDTAGNVYVYNETGRHIDRFDSNGNTSLFWREDLPDHLVAYIGTGQDGYLYVSDFNFTQGTMDNTTDGRIIKISPNGTVMHIIAGNQSMPVFSPSKISASANGTIYTTIGTRSITVFYPDGGRDVIVHTGPDNGTLNRVTDLVIAGDGYLYVIESGNGRVEKLFPGGALVAKWDGCGPERFASICGIAVDNAGRVYVSDLNNQRIVWFDGNSYRYVTDDDSGNLAGKGELWANVFAGDNYTTLQRIRAVENEINNGSQPEETPGFPVLLVCAGFGLTGIVLCNRRYRRD